MKKKLPVLLALLFSGAHAHAQNVTVYGILDLGISVDRGGLAGNSTRVSSGMANQSRWGLRGSEDLGQGLQAFFGLEGGFSADDGAAIKGNIFGRKSAVGLRNSWGSISLGLQETPFYNVLNTIVDPFRNGVARANNVMASTGTRANNALLLQSEAGSVKAALMYAPGEVDGDTGAGRVFGGALIYRDGPWNIGLAYHNKNNNTATVKNNSNARNLLLGTNYDFGIAKIYAGLGRSLGMGSSYFTPGTAFSAKAPAASIDATDLLLGVAIPVGKASLRATYIRKDDHGPLNQDARQIGLGYFYPLSPRTELYTSLDRVYNDNGAAYTAGNSTEAGKGNAQYTVGITHRF